MLARLSRLDRDALRDLLSVSWRLTLAKTRKPKLAHVLPADEEGGDDPPDG